MIELIPAIDIIGGRCVRLTKGDYAAQKVYDANPVDVAKRFQDMGVKRLHLVDLDGAKAAHIVNLDVLEGIASQTSLVVDFGGGIKQLEPVDPAGHIIMDYSIHDAIEAGFNKIVFIIRRDIEEDFRQVIGNRIEALCKEKGVEVCYAFQSLEDIPGQLPEGRTKPWGTNHAVMMGKDIIKEPFAVLNCDDFYDRDAFQVMGKFLSELPEGSTGRYAMVGFRVDNTLTDHGAEDKHHDDLDRCIVPVINKHRRKRHTKAYDKLRHRVKVHP